MIDLIDRQTLIDMTYNREVYGPKLPAMVKEQWVCPYCDFEDVELEIVAAHLVRCNDGESQS